MSSSICLLLFYSLAIKYDAHSENDLFKCTHYECPWSNYTQEIDWDFYLTSGKNISGCIPCMDRCTSDIRCQSIECGDDQEMLDGSFKAAHCSWWSTGSCYKHEDFTLNPQNLIKTCRKKGRI